MLGHKKESKSFQDSQPRPSLPAAEPNDIKSWHNIIGQSRVGQELERVQVLGERFFESCLSAIPGECDDVTDPNHREISTLQLRASYAIILRRLEETWDEEVKTWSGERKKKSVWRDFWLGWMS